MDLDKIFEVADLQLSLNVFDEYGAEYQKGLKQKGKERLILDIERVLLKVGF